MPNKKILLIGYFGKSNIGDDLIIKNFLNNINSNNKTFLMYTDPLFIKKGEINIEVINWKQNEKYIIKLIKLISILKSVSYLIWVGGTCLYGRNNFRGLLGLFVKVWLCKILKVKIMFASVGVGASNFITNMMIKYVIKRVSYISLRDPLSFEVARKLNKHHTYLSGDLVFLDHELEKLKKNTKMGLTKIVFCGHYSLKKSKKMIGFYNRMLKNISDKGAEIIFVPFHKGAKSDNDFHREIIRYNPDFKWKIIENIGFSNIGTFLQKCDFLIGMRLHSLIIADIIGLPNIGINMFEKIGLYKKEIFGRVSEIRKVNHMISMDDIQKVSKNYKSKSEVIKKQQLLCEKDLVRIANIVDNEKVYEK